MANLLIFQIYFPNIFQKNFSKYFPKTLVSFPKIFQMTFVDLILNWKKSGVRSHQIMMFFHDFWSNSSRYNSASFEVKFKLDGAKRICFSTSLQWRAYGARPTERGGYKIIWKLNKSHILSKFWIFEGCFWAPRRAPIPQMALVCI